MKGIIITIGNEILKGDIVNKDLAIIAKTAKAYGIEIEKEITVRDIVKDIQDALTFSAGYDIVFVSGGLGPTEDDLTRTGLANFLNTKLKFDEDLLKSVKERINSWHLPESPLHKQYAYYPEGCKTIDNPTGLASGILCKKDNTIIIVLPGPPRELEPTLKNAMKMLNIPKKQEGIVKIYRTFDIRETEIQEIIRRIDPEKKLKVGYYPSIYGVRVKIEYKNEDEIHHFEPILREKLGNDLYSDENEELEEVFGKIMKKKGLTVSTAESCTGGLIGDLITRVSGSSAYFMGGIIAYSNDVKIKVLGCNEEDLRKYGAVSEQIAEQMAQGARRIIGTDIGIATTGIAGPTGGTPEKPVGLVYIGYSDRETTRVIRKIFKGNREEIKKQSALYALDLARRMIS